MRLFKLAGDIVVNGKEAVADLKKIEKQGESTAGKLKSKFRDSMKTLGKWAKRGAAVGATAMAGLATSSINQFTNFDEKMREVYTLIPDASEDMKEELSEDVQEIGERYGFLVNDTVPALYQALSAGVPPENVMSFMDQAAKAAKAGVTDLQTSVDGLTSAVNAYGQDVLSAQEASDILFTTVKEGKTTFPELSKNMSNVTPIAASLGIKFEGINAALATMTAQGMDTGKATIYLRAMLNQLSKSGSDANNVFKEMAGVTFTEFIAQGNSLADALELMEEYADKNNTSIKKLFSNVRAGTGALQLTGSNMDTFIEKMDEMESSAGSTEEAYGEMSSSLKQALDELRAWWQNQRIAIGEKLEEPLRDLLEFLRKHEGEISDLLQNTFQGLIDALKWMVNNKQKTVNAIKAIGAAFVGWKIGALVSNLWGLAAVLTALGGLKIANTINRMKEAYNTFLKDVGKIDTSKLQENMTVVKAEMEIYEARLQNVNEELEGMTEKEKKFGWGARLVLKKNSLLEKLSNKQERYNNLREEQHKREVSNIEEEISKTEEKLEAKKENLSFLKNQMELNDDFSFETIQNYKDAKSAVKELENKLTNLEAEYKELTKAQYGNKETTDNLNVESKLLSDRLFELRDLGLSLSKVTGKVTDSIQENIKARGQQIHQTVETMKIHSSEEDSLVDLYEGYGKLAEARAKAAKVAREQREAEEDALDIKNERLEILDKEIAKHEALGEEYDETEMRTEAYKDIVEKLIDEELRGTKVWDKVISKLKDLQGEIEDTETSFEKFWEANQEWIRTVKDAFMDFFDKVNEEGKSTAEALTETFIESADEIAGAIATAVSGSPAVGTAVNWIVDIGKGIWDWLFGPSKAQKKINEIAKDLKESIASSLGSAFSADTYSDFVDSFGTSIEEAVKQSMIKAFMATEAMKSKMKKLANLIAEATAPGSAGGISLTDAEKARIKSMTDAIIKRAKPVYDAIKGLDLGYAEGEIKTGTFGSAPGGGGTTTIRTENITPDVIERLGDTVKDQGQNIVKELERQTNLLGGESGQTEVILKLDREVLARKIFELKQTRLRAMGAK